MSLLPQDYMGSLCEVQTLTNERISAGVISGFDSETIELSQHKHRVLATLEIGAGVKLYIYNNKSGHRILSANVFRSTPEYLMLNKVTLLHHNERRGAVRINAKISSQLCPLTGKYPPLQNLSDFLEKISCRVTIVNISLSGVCVVSDKRLAVGGRYRITMPHSHQKTEFLIEVCRLVENDDSSFTYGCSFTNVSDIQAEALSNIIYALMRTEKVFKQA